ncbi:hypothetical protein [Amycolatopsis sp.]|uniref:hypothetical protein n=1 Tax=Amycolatopsis sp. TaxID=37632 RepID=UPI00261732C4|nr:hypothetical protein [Amycolatopsis sp.]
MSGHYLGNDENEPAEEVAAVVAQGVYVKTLTRYGILALASTVAGLLMSCWIYLCAMNALGELPTWGAWVGGVALLPVLALLIVGVFRTGKRTPPAPPPNLAELNTGFEWLWRLLSTPVMPLSIYHLTRHGWPDAAAYASAFLGWLAFDLSTLLSFPARRTLHRLAHLMQPLPKNTPEI